MKTLNDLAQFSLDQEAEIITCEQKRRALIDLITKERK